MHTSKRTHPPNHAQVHVFERTAMAARGAAVMVGVNGLKALQAIDERVLQRLLAQAIKLEGSGEAVLRLECWGVLAVAGKRAVQ